jgi:amino acid permease
MILLGAVTFLVYYRIVVSALIETESKSLIDLTEKFYGKFMKNFMFACIIINMFGCLCAYTVRYN